MYVHLAWRACSTRVPIQLRGALLAITARLSMSPHTLDREMAEIAWTKLRTGTETLQASGSPPARFLAVAWIAALFLFDLRQIP